VEKKGLAQTTQPSDNIDKKYGIWNRVFLDHVDIHHRAGAKKGPNEYGPVLFVFDLELLRKLPPEADILVTKRNPIHWRDGEVDAERFYLTAKELSQELSFGDFDKMLVIETPTGTVKFTDKTVKIAVDDPQRKIRSDEDAYAHAEKRLKAAAARGGITISIQPHDCRDDCICIRKYARYDAAYFSSRFT
jgi:hypothetical protein